MRIEECVFESNHAYTEGGAVYLDNYMASISSTFINNSAGM